MPMPYRIKGRKYIPTERHGKKNDYSTFRYKRTPKGNYLMFGKRRRGRRWKLYEVLGPA